jgi:hypothetical protein
MILNTHTSENDRAHALGRLPTRKTAVGAPLPGGARDLSRRNARIPAWLEPAGHLDTPRVSRIEVCAPRRWLAAGVTVALLLLAGLAQAATLTVINNADAGPGSLRQAIRGAAAGDTIQFDMTQAVTFYDGTAVLGTSRLGWDGTARLTTCALAKGSHPITAKFTDGTYFASSTSSVLTEVVQ